LSSWRLKAECRIAPPDPADPVTSRMEEWRSGRCQWVLRWFESRRRRKLNRRDE
jgi:hypothetical protein